MKAQHALFMSDCHIKNRTWTNSVLLSGDASAALDRVLKTAVDRQISDLIIGGDWFDNARPSSDDIFTSAAFLRRFERVFYIAGNHDRTLPQIFSSFGCFECDSNTQFIQLGEEPVPLLKCNYRSIITLEQPSPEAYICGIPWTPSGAELKESLSACCSRFREVAGSDDVLYIVMHTAFEHLLGYDGAYKITADDVSSLTSDICCRVLVGDIHTRHTLPMQNGGYIHSTGALYPTSFPSDTSLRYAMSDIELLSGTVSDVPSDVRRYIVTDYCTQEEQAHKLAEYSGDEMPLQPFVRMRLSEDQQDARINESDYSGCVVQVVRSSQHSINNREVYNDDTRRFTIIDAAKEALDGDDDLQQLAESLLVSADPLKEISGWIDFWGAERTSL